MQYGPPLSVDRYFGLLARSGGTNPLADGAHSCGASAEFRVDLV